MNTSFAPQQRMITPEKVALDALQSTHEADLRPQGLHQFTGQHALKENLQVFINAAKQRQKALDHSLLFGPPGLGKTSLARIIAAEMGVGFRSTSGPVIEKGGDLAAILTSLEPNDVLFIDEIHRLRPQLEEYLYPAMEDFQLDIIIGEGPAARTVKVDVPPFTLVGATTRAGALTNPLRDRFGIQLRLEFYEAEDLASILTRAANVLGIGIDAGGAHEIARRSRGTPRIANRLLKRVRDFADMAQSPQITSEIAKVALEKLGVDNSGLDANDHRYLHCLNETFGGGPVGVETLAAAMGESKDTIEDAIEPYLLQQGLIQRTPQGRMSPKKAERA